MELVLIRHAHPISEERMDGSPADPPLSATGVEQSRAVAEWLARNPPDRLVSSPALRARQTAEESARRLGQGVEVDDRLCDATPLLSRYVTLEEERARDAIVYRRRLDDYREGDHLAVASARVNAALDEWTAAHPGKRLAVFCHGSVVNVYAARVLGLAELIFLDVGYASGHRFLISRDAVRSVKSLNETAYLS
jgi:probable phosphoglycerate mutase